MSHILLKVQKASGKYVQVTFLQGFTKQFVIMADKAS